MTELSREGKESQKPRPPRPRPHRLRPLSWQWEGPADPVQVHFLSCQSCSCGTRSEVRTPDPRLGVLVLVWGPRGPCLVRGPDLPDPLWKVIRFP